MKVTFRRLNRSERMILKSVFLLILHHILRKQAVSQLFWFGTRNLEVSVMPWMIYGLGGGSVLGNDGNLAYFICLILQLLLLVVLKKKTLLTKENEARMELHRPCSLQCIKLYIMLVIHKHLHMTGKASRLWCVPK